MHFEANLEHQRAAIAAVADIFEGAAYTQPEQRIWSGEVSGNHIALPESVWFENAKRIAINNLITEPYSSDDPDFTIEMETGTGKTYVYLRTIFELHRRYGLHKFIIVVPSIAIREGVLATARDTKQHFREIYAEQARVIEYNSKDISEVKSFCVTNTLCIMVMNMQAFGSDKNVINDEARDSGNVMELLRQARPVIIMDEPQEGMDTPNMQARLAAFNPLFKLRYSATHNTPKNIVYRLTPMDSYNLGLVKKIEVLSIHETNTQSNVAIAFKKLNLSSKDPTAQLEVNVRLKGGDFKSKAITVKRRDCLEQKTNNPLYHGWIVEDIGTTDLYDGEGYIKFTNGERITQGSSSGVDKETIFRQQIRRTIQMHFKRKPRLLAIGIKPLALFFIDRVANYTDTNGLIRRIFVEEYESLYPQFHGGSPATNTHVVYGGYFAKTSSGEFTDNVKSMATNKEIYDKILNAKATLLSPEEPLEFIFSHSALGVGWDNPNVFAICTLNESENQNKKRQEIGRGLRLCVDKYGKRYRDPEGTPEGQEVNLLTVIPNQSYHAFSSDYQREVQEEMGEGAKAPPMRNGNKESTIIRRNSQRFTSADFQALWELIARKTTYRITFREETLIDESVAALRSLAIEGNYLNITLTRWQGMSEDGSIEHATLGSARADIGGASAIIDIIAELAKLSSLSENTACAILSGLPDVQKQQLAKNPMLFISEAAKKIRHVLNREMVKLVKYEVVEGVHPLTLFEEVIETKANTTATPKHGLYDRIIHDSDIEHDMACELDAHPAVRVLVKLPKEYKIPTPIGNYTPDFALVVEKRNLDHQDAPSQFFFVIETKGADEWEKLKPEERMKIKCAIKHFEAIGLHSYLAPVESLKTFDKRALERVRETFLTA
jgi:type III restriction enzyme